MRLLLVEGSLVLLGVLQLLLRYRLWWLVVARRLDFLGLHGHPCAHQVIVGLEIVQIRFTQVAEVLGAKGPDLGFRLCTRDGHDDRGDQRKQNQLAKVLFPQSRVPPRLYSKIIE